MVICGSRRRSRGIRLPEPVADTGLQVPGADVVQDQVGRAQPRPRHKRRRQLSGHQHPGRQAVASSGPSRPAVLGKDTQYPVSYEESQTGPRQHATRLNQGHCGSPEDNPVLILPASDAA
jgi:hypothetical protein